MIGSEGRVMFLVTGGAGFIGSHLAARLVDQGGAVRVFDDFSTGKRDNLEAVGDRIDLIEGDLRDPDAVRRAVAGARVIFHQAALSSVQRSVEDPRTTLDVNLSGTLNVLQAAREAGCQRVVFASSAAVYGDAPGLPKTETMAPRPLSPYAISKLAGEQLCSVFTHVHGLETVALRYFNVFGPRQDPSSPYSGVISRFLLALQTGAPPVIFGDGVQSRDFVYVDDVVAANLLAAEAPAAAGRVFNIATGRAVSLNHLLRTLATLTGTEPRAHHEPARPGDIRHSLADIGAAKKTLGYAAEVALEDGLARTVAAFRLEGTDPTPTGVGLDVRSGGSSEALAQAPGD
jgi:UDP-glucose 4-epimerase